MIIEIVVAVLLVVTIGYCFTLNQRLKRLRSDEASLRATISELITATEIAERAILGLKSTAGNADKTLGERLGEAEALSRRLSSQIGVGADVLDRVGQVADAAVAGQPTSNVNSYEAAAAAAEEVAARVAAHAEYTHAQMPAQPAAPAQMAQPAVQQPAPAQPAPQEPRHSRVKDIFKAAEASTSRLEQFRRRAQG
ncbi:DUF6468 domain-containing protein [Pseudovibrio sp. SPO723]|uniref:DUF6468 domain-containing protein n=1 Tax=Nesiotobacter zosterae TaxID=392721 RepID=UPI0029C37DF1|nr:DUF6468 domain-containing protein [Pseudovibrio sp. SPO723]MDX5594157.1 DUF6468 domain-containing protein [Pseudovibrio sp. SPO723]